MGGEEVAEHRVDPEQGLAMLPDLTTAGRQRLMGVAGLQGAGNRTMESALGRRRTQGIT
jgi:hypothetical protein